MARLAATVRETPDPRLRGEDYQRPARDHGRRIAPRPSPARGGQAAVAVGQGAPVEPSTPRLRGEDHSRRLRRRRRAAASTPRLRGKARSSGAGERPPTLDLRLRGKAWSRRPGRRGWTSTPACQKTVRHGSRPPQDHLDPACAGRTTPRPRLPPAPLDPACAREDGDRTGYDLIGALDPRLRGDDRSSPPPNRCSLDPACARGPFGSSGSSAQYARPRACARQTRRRGQAGRHARRRHPAQRGKTRAPRRRDPRPRPHLPARGRLCHCRCQSSTGLDPPPAREDGRRGGVRRSLP